MSLMLFLLGLGIIVIRFCCLFISNLFLGVYGFLILNWIGMLFCWFFFLKFKFNVMWGCMVYFLFLFCFLFGMIFIWVLVLLLKWILMKWFEDDDLINKIIYIKL